MSKSKCGRGDQEQYNTLLNSINALNKSVTECINYLVSKGFSYNQAKNAIHVYKKGGNVKSTFRLEAEERNRLLDGFQATEKKPREAVNFLMEYGCSYRQATSAVYKYRKERGLIGK